MQTQNAILKLSEAERPLGDRLLKIAVEIDRIEGYSEPHALMIARLSERLGTLLGLHGTDLTALKYAALLHDIGERVMRRNYLLRADDLTWEETLDLWRHPILGEQAASELKLTRQVQLLIRWHHEWWNGLGYPDGLSGETIPLGARILRTVDSYCALVSKRPHRRRFDAIEAEQIIADLAGIEFDPQVAKMLVALIAKERGLQELAIVSPVASPVAFPVASPVASIDSETRKAPEVAQPSLVAAEYRPEPALSETYPIPATQDAPQIIELSPVEPEEQVLYVVEPAPKKNPKTETIFSKEKAESSTPMLELPELPVLEELPELPVLQEELPELPVLEENDEKEK
ncbi:MAG: HD domain-containing protein [Blastocatellia bacterium]|nr:HD domain-containing protein [Blastocatellia bacterium]